MGIERYSRDSNRKRWEQAFDELQRRCHDAWGTPTIGDLLDHGIHQAYWQCRSVGWRADGKDICWHTSQRFHLDKFGRTLEIAKMRRLYVCSACGRNRPYLQLEAD